MMAQEQSTIPGRSGPKPKCLAELFWPRVQKSEGCWLWTGAKDRYGYGEWIGVKLPFRGRIKPHRASWLLHFGDIPQELWVLHKCDNRSCVRPDHLFLGTPLDNNQDMAAKGRSARGESQHSAVFAEEQVREIRRSYEPASSGGDPRRTRLKFDKGTC